MRSDQKDLLLHLILLLLNSVTMYANNSLSVFAFYGIMHDLVHF